MLKLRWIAPVSTKNGFYRLKQMTALATRTIEKTKSSTILQRVANNDKTAVEECIDSYGNFIWALAKKFTASKEEAEAAAQEIFLDIWRYSKHVDYRQSADDVLIAMIARRRLLQYLQVKASKNLCRT